MEPHRELFWLHVKKSAGITTRSLLSPYYVSVDRTKRPKNFIQADRSEYNDILNNYRTLLGEYQFKRSLFAKKYLYPDQWDQMYSFAFVREPVDRCISMFYYLFWPHAAGVKNVLKTLVTTRRMVTSESRAFDLFLDLIEQSRTSDSSFLPIDLHFTTHTAAVWDDVTDEQGQLVLTRVFRLDDLTPAINTVFQSCGLPKRLDVAQRKLNRNDGRRLFTVSAAQRLRIEKLFERDFSLYESSAL